MGLTSSCSGRDHVDFDTEISSGLNSYEFTVRNARVMQSQGIWPPSHETLANTSNIIGTNGLVVGIRLNRIGKQESISRFTT
jgi:hypothetical protein